jgi:Arc/MetJ-type ribon-helix-helix transcriptional regulator
MLGSLDNESGQSLLASEPEIRAGSVLLSVGARQDWHLLYAVMRSEITKSVTEGPFSTGKASHRCFESFLPPYLTDAVPHLSTIHADAKWMVKPMVSNVSDLRPKPSDTEKITINLGYVDLGHVDLMVQEGFYSNRTDFIRTAIRNQLERHADVVKQSTVRKSLDLGLRNYSREDLESVQRAGEVLDINVLGLATIAQDVTPELARATIASVSVLGALHATPAVKAALADRTR